MLREPREARQPLVVFGNGFGDHLINLPALRGLAAGFAGRLGLLCFPKARQRFFSELPLRQAVEVAFPRRDGSELESWAADLELPPCDLLIWLNPWKADWLSWLRAELRPERAIGFFSVFDDHLPLDFTKHSADLAFDITRHIFPELRLEDFAQPPVLPVDAWRGAERLRSKIPAEHRVLVVHADTGQEKCWDSERFRTVLDRFLDRHPRTLCFLVGDKDLGLEAIDHAERMISLRGLDIALSMAFLARADFFLGVDSCFLHAADFFRVPAVGLFGPTDPREFGFRLDGVWRHVGGRGSMADIHVDEVLRSLAEVCEESVTQAA